MLQRATGEHFPRGAEGPAWALEVRVCWVGREAQSEVLLLRLPHTQALAGPCACWPHSAWAICPNAPLSLSHLRAPLASALGAEQSLMAMRGRNLNSLRGSQKPLISALFFGVITVKHFPADSNPLASSSAFAPALTIFDFIFYLIIFPWAEPAAAFTGFLLGCGVEEV